MASIKYWLWLSSAVDVSPGSKIALLAYYGDPERAYAAPEGEFEKIEGITAGDAKKLERRDLSKTEDIMEACDMYNISVLTLNDAAYPSKLKNISAPPVVLFIRGTLPDIDGNATVAVVGTRNASAYGIKMAGRMGTELASSGALIVNGLSGSVENTSAKAALRAGGTCIAVLGTAHDKEAEGIEADIEAHGAVISEYPPGTRAMRSFFRDRNRITAGLCDGVIAVEAPMKSGTLLFVEEATNQGREIFAVPGNADSENSRGTNWLIQQGAKLVTCAWDALSELEALYRDRLRKPAESHFEPEPEVPAVKPAKEKAIDKKENTAYIDWQEQLKALNPDQLKIIAAIEKSASHVDDIVAETGLSVAKVLGQLTVLEIKGYIRRSAAKTIVLNIAKK